MIGIFFLLSSVILIILLNKFFIKKNILLSQSGEIHQKFVEKNSIPLIGGIIFTITFLILFLSIKKYILILSILSMFILGILSDLKIVNYPKTRFFFQTLLILIFAYLIGLQIVSTRIFFFDYLLNYKIINFVFVIFCILILVNGTNFIDGLNGLVTGYYILISIILLKIGFFEYLDFSQNSLLIFFGILIVVFLFNISNKLYLGDSGTYSLSIFFGFTIINYHQTYFEVSPYFIILLLWYPCFENLFSIIRKFRYKISPIYPDENHLHQVLFYFIKKKLNMKNLSSNNFTSFIILIYNGIFIFLGSNNIYSTKLQIFLISISSLIYIFVYILLFKYKYKNFKKN